MTTPRYPSLYQVNTRTLLWQIGARLGRQASFDDIPDSELDAWASYGVHWVWLLGVWQTGAAGRAASRAQPEWRHEFREALPDLAEEDICGSCFAIAAYEPHRDFGGRPALVRLRDRLRRRGLRVMLDFVPNHTAPDHPWVTEHPDYYVHGTEADLARAPQNYTRIETGRGPAVIAYGRDPFFPGWPDTLQLNYGNPDLRTAMTAELLRIAELCDGVRCDMSMLILPEVFQRTWGITMAPFWPQAIAAVRARWPDFVFMAEVYWDLEWTLQQQGFDFVYDKRLYDRLQHDGAGPVRDHLHADPAYQDRLARFLENHDEPRAAAAFSPDMHRAAAIVTFFVPGLRFFHQGEFEGRKVRTPMHLRRARTEETDDELAAFYGRLLTCLVDPVFAEGRERLLEPSPAWEGNWTSGCFIATCWEKDGAHFVTAVNYAPHQSQCYIRLPLPDVAGRSVQLIDRMGPARYERASDDLTGRGLYLDMPPWGFHVFELR